MDLVRVAHVHLDTMGPLDLAVVSASSQFEVKPPYIISELCIKLKDLQRLDVQNSAPIWV